MKNAGSTVFCTIVPPHIYDRLGKSAYADIVEAAHKNAKLTERLRGQRDVLSLLPSLARTPGAVRRTVYDAATDQTLPGAVVRGEGGPAVADTCVNEAYDGAGLVADFYRTRFRRDSIDGRGMRLDSTVHYGVKFDNAFWNGSQMVYGDGDGVVLHNFTSTIDVIAHEMTHGVTQSESALEYEGESGALNEHLSDVFGSVIKQYALNQAVAQADWLIGEGVLVAPTPMPAGGAARALRDMLNPGTAYANLPDLGDDPQPAHMNDLFTGSEDNGGVHINSGIPNKAFATFAMAVGGNSWDPAGPAEIWYQTATASGLQSTATFQDFRDLTVGVAKRIAAKAAVDALVAAWASVGL
jgi:Zn-dependent metalloprotease